MTVLSEHLDLLTPLAGSRLVGGCGGMVPPIMGIYTMYNTYIYKYIYIYILYKVYEYVNMSIVSSYPDSMFKFFRLSALGPFPMQSSSKKLTTATSLEL
jgi:hypothetical protein